MKTPEELANLMWEAGIKHVEGTQAVFILINDPPGCGTETAAFRHNLSSTPEVISFLSQMINALETEILRLNKTVQ